MIALAVVTPERSFAMARAIRACGGQPRLTMHPAHDDPALYFWLLAQRRLTEHKEIE